MDENQQVVAEDEITESSATQKVVTAIVAGAVVSVVAVVGVKLVQRWRNRNEDAEEQEVNAKATPTILAKKAAPSKAQ